MSQTIKRRVNVRAIIYRDGKLLAVKHKQPDGSEAEYWAIPGGGLETHESLTAGVAREVAEELGIAANIGRLLFIQQFRSKRRGFEEELELFFEVTNPEDYEAIDLSKTTHGLEEIARCEFVDPKTSFVLPQFLSKVDIGQYIERDQAPFIIDNFDEVIEH